MQPAEVSSRTYRLPASAYLAVLFLLFCALPLAFAGDSSEGSRAVYGWRLVFLLIPVVAIVFIARTATIVSPDGIRVRAVLGSRRLGWDVIRGLNVAERSVYVVVDDGALKLPCVRISDLATVSRLSRGRLPEVPEATPKYAPSRRSRRR